MEGYACISLSPIHPAILRRVSAEELTSREWAFCALDPWGAQQVRGGIIRCDTLLLPDGVGLVYQARQAVSYGLSEKNSLTLSGMEHPFLCVQRQLQAVNGQTVEMQELPLPLGWSNYSDEQQLFLAGVHLLLEGGLYRLG